MDWSLLKETVALTLPDRLSVELEKLIINGDLASGSKLPAERDLAEILGLSRISVRQALRELEVRGLIDRSPGRGTTVISAQDAAKEPGTLIAAALSGESRNLPDIMELRMVIEPPIAALTASRATPRDVAQLRNLVEQMSLDVPVARYAELDRSFHQAIANYTHNPLLAVMAEQIALLVAPSRNSTLQTKQRRKNSTAEHQRILDAIARADPDGAEREATNHLKSVTEEILITQATHPQAPRS